MATTRTALEKWVENARLIQKERNDWALGKQLLQDRIALVKSQIATLRTKIAGDEKEIATTDKKKSELEEENLKLEATTASLQKLVDPLEARVTALLKRMPKPLQDQVLPLSQLIPVPNEKGEKKTEAGLAERLRNVIGILNEANKFHGNILVTPETRTLADGRSANVATIYLGVAQAFYVTAKGDAAGVGTPTGNGWVWTPANDAAPAIARVVAILNSSESAAFVPLPVRIR